MMIDQANKLAKKNNVSRKTLSVRHDTGRKQWAITQETSTGVKDAEGYRADVDYYFFDDNRGLDLNILLKQVKSHSTMAFLGLECDSKAKDEVTTPAPEEVAEAVAKVPQAPAAVYEAPIEKPKRTRGPNKKKPEEAKAPVPVEETKADNEFDFTEEEGIKYQKSKNDHAVHLRDLVEDRFGSDWKKDKQAVTVVKGLVAKLHNQVAVVNEEGEVLQSFVEYVGKILKAA